MKHLINIIFIVVCSYNAYSQGKTSISRELPRADFMSFRNLESALANDITKSENFLNLNGEWECKTESQRNDKAKINLPANVEFNGYGAAIYSEKAYPFVVNKENTEHIKLTDKTTYEFSREFFVPFDYIEKALFLHIGAANSTSSVLINDTPVGYSTDSRSPAEFDISQYVTGGNNKITIKVTDHELCTMLEGQPGWKFCGINRDIYIFAQPKIRIRDFVANTTLDPTYTNGLLETSLILKTQLLNTHQITVYYDLYDPQGGLVNQSSREITTSMRGEDTVRFSATILNVQQWNAETPKLYTIVYRIQREGRFTEYASIRAGFRTSEIRDGRFLINGKAIKIKGVNFAEFSPITGNVLTKSSLRESINQIKHAGINAIRTDGYPLSSDFYELCDQMGIYVCDVANINAQGIGTSLSRGKTLANDPRWVDHFVYRVNNMYERNKTHTSVIMWALGDNAGNGNNMYGAYMMLKSKDTSRPIIYNGGGMEFNSDIYCPDSITPADFEKVKQKLDGQPVILSRCDIDPQIWASSEFQGGFIERWDNPSISVKQGVKLLELSDDYKLRDSDGVISGAAARENLKQISAMFSNIEIRTIDRKKGEYEITNKNDFADLKDLKITCHINNKKQSVFEIKDVAAKPGEKTTITLPKNVVKEINSGKSEVTISVGEYFKQTVSNEK